MELIQCCAKPLNYKAKLSVAMTFTAYDIHVLNITKTYQRYFPIFDIMPADGLASTVIRISALAKFTKLPSSANCFYLGVNKQVRKQLFSFIKIVHNHLRAHT